MLFISIGEELEAVEIGGGEDPANELRVGTAEPFHVHEHHTGVADLCVPRRALKARSKEHGSSPRECQEKQLAASPATLPQRCATETQGANGAN